MQPTSIIGPTITRISTNVEPAINRHIQSEVPIQACFARAASSGWFVADPEVEPFSGLLPVCWLSAHNAETSCYLLIFKQDPFATLDQAGVGQLVKMAVAKGRNTRPKLKVGICGEHGGDPESVKFCHKIDLNYVSCSPFRLLTARLAAAQAVLEERAPPTSTSSHQTAKAFTGVRNPGASLFLYCMRSAPPIFAMSRAPNHALAEIKIIRKAIPSTAERKKLWIDETL